MSKTRAALSGGVEQSRSQVSGERKDEFLRCVLQDIPDLDEELAAQIAVHLSGRIDVIKADRAIIESYRKPAFDPNGFSLMRVYRTSGATGLRGRLNEISERRHLQALAKAQQISLPNKLRGKSADLAALRDAILEGVAKRKEDWQAAS